MSECRWPKGCSMPVGLVEGQADGLCYFHWKGVNGLIGARDLVAKVGIRSSDVVSSEMAEIAEVLKKLGAPPWVIERALTKRLSIGDSGRKGRGVKAGRVLNP